jgi:GMP synthase-like glutamine amidotransferase
VKVLVIETQPTVPIGTLGPPLEDAGLELLYWRPAEAAPPGSLAGISGVVALGGAANPDEEARHPWLAAERELLASATSQRIPTVGVCLGAELLAAAAGWEVTRLPVSEIGWHEVELTAAGRDDPLIGGTPSRFPAFQWHSYASEPPDGAPVLAENPACAQAYRVADRAWGIQFHAEVDAATIEHWLDDGKDDEDVREVALDIDAVRERTRHGIAAWNELGRGLCTRFLELAAG